jgi:DNA-directed RNA polymerase specialized sigma24 family protein
MEETSDGSFSRSSIVPQMGSPGVSQGSVTCWISQLQAGDQAAVDPLWGRYFERMVELARVRLLRAPRQAADEEDVALSAFHSFCRAAEQGRFPKLDDRDDVWRLLVVLTTRKAAHLIRDGNRLKRGGGGSWERGGEEVDLDLVAGEEPDPKFVAEVAEESRRLLSRLDDAQRAIVMWKMEGYTNEEVAVKLACVPRTVERKLRLIRAIWEGEP